MKTHHLFMREDYCRQWLWDSIWEMGREKAYEYWMWQL